MATKYVEEYATEAAFLADAVDAPGKLGVAGVGEKLVLNKSGSVVEVVDETATQTLTNKTLTSPTITGAVLSPASVTGPAETVITTNVITAAESGTTFFLNLAAGFLSTLPVPAAGLKYKFVVKTAPTGGAGYTISSGAAGADIFYGVVHSVPADDAGIAIAAQDLLTLVNDAAIIGDWIEVESDGTNWYVRGGVAVVEGLTVAQS